MFDRVQYTPLLLVIYLLHCEIIVCQWFIDIFIAFVIYWNGKSMQEMVPLNLMLFQNETTCIIIKLRDIQVQVHDGVYRTYFVWYILMLLIFNFKYYSICKSYWLYNTIYAIGRNAKEDMKRWELVLREKYPCSEFFWSVFSHIRTEYGEMRSISPHSVWMRENTDQKNSEYGNFSRSVIYFISLFYFIFI